MSIGRKLKTMTMRCVAEVRYRNFGSNWPEVDRCFLCNTAAYRNIGDHAITLAEIEFIKRYFPSKRIIEITSEEWRRCSCSKTSSYANDNDVFFIHGGGYFGTQWGGGEEEIALSLMERFPHNRFIVFPQTIFFSNDKYGSQLKRDRVARYKRISNLTLFVREQKSYETAVQMDCFGGGVYLVPDIVLSLDRSDLDFKRHGVLLCFREDEEKCVDSISDSLLNYLRSRGLEVRRTDMVAEKSFPLEDRFNMVEDKINQFASCEAVITDRLHAMILCAISCTPCIALNNSNGKVFGVYNWIKNLPYIQICDDVRLLERDLPQLLNRSGDTVYDWRGLDAEFNKMAALIKNIAFSD